MASNLRFAIERVQNFAQTAYNGVVLITSPSTKIPSVFQSAISAAASLDKNFEKEVTILPVDNIAGGRLIHASTGKIDPDYDDVRIFKDTAYKAIKRALSAGVTKPIIVVDKYEPFKNCELVTLLGALEALYVPLEVREDVPSKAKKVDALGVYSSNPSIDEIITLAKNLESGLIVARDIGGSDPERMAPPKVQEYVENEFNSSNISIDVVSDSKELKAKFPLFQAVNRCAEHVERHKGRIIFLTYNPSNDGDIPKKNYYLVGKGVTYDTGGVDIKAGGVMQGMSRDKCGAAAVAGFMKVVSLLAPRNVKIVGIMCMVRNSVGSDAYVSDEIITARSGARVRIGNTDAEGRMAMADSLCYVKELAEKSPQNTHLYTIATLTGHAIRAMGKGYSIVLDNGPARKQGHDSRLSQIGVEIADPFEISTLRKEDIQFHEAKSEGDDIIQANNLPSTMTARGHQGPGGFLLLASGLVNNGSGSEKPIAYSHLDIAASGGFLPENATGAPILALVSALLLNN
ncbi:putative aminopeptidase W07G4.4 [Chrysoperla carnea]|uniref:putative aminopeptidase W07G4.4 n=1 Tax=Chrysoperla carnea TaxID=189513 RepID=UPI001D0885BD|nr:putative aminopeptidase W07G4.4 [Chrysoperla carnea]